MKWNWRIFWKYFGEPLCLLAVVLFLLAVSLVIALVFRALGIR